MKALVQFYAVVLAVATSAAASAQPVGDCAGIVQSVNELASAIAGNANSYWAHRANFVELIFGPSGLSVANAAQTAEQDKTQAEALQAPMPARLARFKDVIATAQSQSCLSPSQLSAIAEPTIKLAKRVNFDQFPQELPLESTVERGPPEMPQK